MRALEFLIESDKQLTVYTPAEKDPWLKDPEMAKAREEKRDYVDSEGRLWSFSQSDIGFRNYQGLRNPKNIPGVNLFKGKDIVGQRVYHCTNSLKAIEKSGGLKPRPDRTGADEYGRLTTHWDPMIPVIGIWFSVGKPDWAGKYCLSFVIEPTDQVAVAYAKSNGNLNPNIVLNAIPMDRLTVEKR